MNKFFSNLKYKMILQNLLTPVSGDNKTIRAFIKKLEDHGWKGEAHRYAYHLTKNGCSIDIHEQDFEIQSGLLCTRCYYSELDLNPTTTIGNEPLKDNIIYIGTHRCNIDVPPLEEITNWGDDEEDEEEDEEE